MGRASTKENKNIYQKTREALRLTRETGGETVLVRPGDSAAFWSRYGFRPGTQADTLEKGISFDPAYLALPPAEV